MIYIYICSLIVLIIITIIIKNNKEGMYTKINLCFYTCFYGSENNIAFQIPPVPSNHYKCFYYTNNKVLLNKIKNTEWIGIYDDIKTIDDDIIDSCMKGKNVKVLTHKYKEINNFNYTCFYDSKYEFIDETVVENLIDTYFVKQNYALLLRKHPFITNSVFNELKESLKQQRYVTQSSQYTRYIEHQLNNNLSSTTDIHACCGFLIRNMKHPQINNINNTWFEHIQECGIQDQISFFFIKQLYKKYIFVFDDNICKNIKTDFMCK